MNPAVNGVVRVEKGGTLLVRTGSGFMTYTGKPYAVQAYDGSAQDHQQQRLRRRLILAGNGSNGGVFINATNVLIQDSLFNRDYYGIIAYGRDISIGHCSFTNITGNGPVRLQCHGRPDGQRVPMGLDRRQGRGWEPARFTTWPW